MSKNGVNPEQARQIAQQALAQQSSEILQAVAAQAANHAQRMNDVQIMEQMAGHIFAAVVAHHGINNLPENAWARAAVDAITVFAEVRVFAHQEKLAERLIGAISQREAAARAARTPVPVEVAPEGGAGGGAVVGSIGEPSPPPAPVEEPSPEKKGRSSDLMGAAAGVGAATTDTGHGGA